MNYYLLFFVISFFSCHEVIQSNTKENISIQILNKEVKLPSNDQYACSDTIFFQIFNNSDYEYLFDIVDTTGFFFLNEKPRENDLIDPFGGFGIRFLDENKHYLKSDGYNVFNPEGFEKMVIKEMVYKLLPKKSITLKIPLAFPSELDFGNYIQKIPDINRTTNVEILFRPGNGYLKNILLKNGKFKLKKNQKIMDVSEYFLIPIKFECQGP